MRLSWLIVLVGSLAVACGGGSDVPDPDAAPTTDAAPTIDAAVGVGGDARHPPDLPPIPCDPGPQRSADRGRFLLLAGLALASFAGAATALILNLAPTPYAALEIAFWLLGSLEDRSVDHLIIATPFLLASWILLALHAPAFRALTLGEDAAASLGVDIDRTRRAVVVGVAFGVGAAVSICGSIGFVGLVAPHLVRRLVNSDPARVMLPAASLHVLTGHDANVKILTNPHVRERADARRGVAKPAGAAR